MFVVDEATVASLQNTYKKRRGKNGSVERDVQNFVSFMQQSFEKCEISHGTYPNCLRASGNPVVICWLVNVIPFLEKWMLELCKHLNQADVRSRIYNRQI